jgi:hypothetical protein
MRGIDQHHAGDLAGMRFVEDADVHAADRVTDQDVWRLDVRAFKQRVEIRRDLAAIRGLVAVVA